MAKTSVTSIEYHVGLLFFCGWIENIVYYPFSVLFSFNTTVKLSYRCFYHKMLLLHLFSIFSWKCYKVLMKTDWSISWNNLIINYGVRMTILAKIDRNICAEFLIVNGIVVRVLNSQSRDLGFNTTGCLHVWVSLSSLHGRSSECQELLGTQW